MTMICSTPSEAVAGIADGSTVLIGGFGMAGMPVDVVDALIKPGASDLTVVSNNAGNGERGLDALLAKGRVRKVICHSRAKSIRGSSMGCTSRDASS